ncbi:hypothetical protein D3C72_1987690 [compost metagenome]
MAFDIGDHRRTEENLVAAHRHQVDPVAVEDLHAALGNDRNGAGAAIDVKGVVVGGDAAAVEDDPLGLDGLDAPQAHDVADALQRA